MTPMDSVINHLLLQLNFISLQSPENKRCTLHVAIKCIIRYLDRTECRIPSGNVTMPVTVSAPM